MLASEARIARIVEICAREDLRTDDPYDVWMTRLGYSVKDLYNRHPIAALPAAAALSLIDTYVNNRSRLFYGRREYPIVRAWAALTLLNVVRETNDSELLPAVRRHLDWLRRHACVGYHGPCWGLGFEYAVSAEFQYGENTPLSTMTPYPLEAFVGYADLTGDDSYSDVIGGVFHFLEHDLVVMEETADYLVTSYAAMRDRRVVNAVSYVMYSYSLLYRFLGPDDKVRAADKIRKLYAFVALQQRDDGSWLYSPDGKSFIDCFHSCIVLKNLIKTNRRFPDSDREERIHRGYRYLMENFLVESKGLFKRFTASNKPSLVAYDLYDNAEMLNLGLMMNDDDMVAALASRIDQYFVEGDMIYSQIDCFGLRQNRDMLRWATMPYLYALTSPRRQWTDAAA